MYCVGLGDPFAVFADGDYLLAAYGAVVGGLWIGVFLDDHLVFAFEVARAESGSHDCQIIKGWSDGVGRSGWVEENGQRRAGRGCTFPNYRPVRRAQDGAPERLGLGEENKQQQEQIPTG